MESRLQRKLRIVTYDRSSLQSSLQSSIRRVLSEVLSEKTFRIKRIRKVWLFYKTVLNKIVSI